MHTINVRDGKECLNNISVLITQPDSISIGTTQTNVLCKGGNTGVINVSANGGTAPYSYAIGSGSFGNGNVFTNLTAGNYIVKVKDSVDCIKEVAVTITEPDSISIGTTETNVLCYGSNTGAINVSATGGFSPYTYAIGSGTFGASNVFNNLTAGTYVIKVQDSALCQKQVNVTITQPDSISIGTTEYDVNCYEGSNGLIMINASGGIAPYKYALNSGAYGNNDYFDGLTAGTYTVKVKDSFECVNEVNVVINQPDSITITAIPTHVLCNGDSTGVINVSAIGGTSPYEFAIDTNVFGTNQIYSNLPTNTYLISVRDAHECLYTTNVLITQPDVLTIDSTIFNPICFGDATGYIETSTLGGTSPYQYLWNTGDATEDLMGIIAGNYWLTTTDINGCSRKDSFTLTNPDSFYINLGEDRTLCAEQSVELNAAIPENGTTYLWNSNKGYNSTDVSVNISDSAKYWVTATTPLGCIVTDTIAIHLSTEIIDANFAAATQSFKDIVYTLVNISKPRPDSIEWILPPSPACSVITKQFGFAEVVFTDTGVYNIGLKTFKGDCEAIMMSSIVVVHSSTLPPADNPRAPFIKKYVAYPNPSDGNFKVDILLDKPADISLTLINALNGKIENIQSLTGVEETTVSYNLSLSSGTYIILLETPHGAQTLKIQIF